MRLKLILIGLLSFLCGSFVNVSAQEDYDVYLLVGQSNMAGRGYMLEGDDEPFDENVFMLDDQGKVIPATNPLNQYSRGYVRDMALHEKSLRRLAGGYCLWSMLEVVRPWISGQRVNLVKATTRRR